MTKKQKQELAEIEEQILKVVKYNENSIIPFSLSNLTHREIEQLEKLIGNRYVLLNEMFLCTTNEIERFKQVNERLKELTDKMHTKALKLYRSILKEGYDPDFDDDIMLEATLRYVFNDEQDSVISDEIEPNLYNSPFAQMLDILYEFYRTSGVPECAQCYISYNLDHKCEMSAAELGIEDDLNDGESWSEGYLYRAEFKHICICYAVHDLCTHKYYSIPDLLRMNDFMIDIKITHQHIVNQFGKRHSFIEI